MHVSLSPALPPNLTHSSGAYPEPGAASPHIPTLFPKIYSNVIIPYTPTSSEWSLPSRFSAQKHTRILICPMCATCPSHSHADGSSEPTYAMEWTV